jgi:hypothetical protein
MPLLRALRRECSFQKCVAVTTGRSVLQDRCLGSSRERRLRSHCAAETRGLGETSVRVACGVGSARSTTKSITVLHFVWLLHKVALKLIELHLTEYKAMRSLRRVHTHVLIPRTPAFTKSPWRLGFRKARISRGSWYVKARQQAVHRLP